MKVPRGDPVPAGGREPSDGSVSSRIAVSSSESVRSVTRARGFGLSLANSKLADRLAGWVRCCFAQHRKPRGASKAVHIERELEPMRQGSQFPLHRAENGKTERAGFEPAMEFDPHTRLAGECLQPLGHLSLRIGTPV